MTNEGRISQSLRANKLPVHDPAFCQFLPNLLGIDVIEGVFFHIRCGINDLGRMGMVAPHFFRGFFQSVKGTVNISGSPVHHAIMVVIKTVDMEPYLNFLTVICKVLYDLILNAVEGNLGKLFFRKGSQLVKIRVSKLLLRQLFQGAVFSGIHDNAVNVPIQFEIHQVNADLNGDFFIRDGGVGNIDFMKVREIRFAVVFLSAECCYQHFGFFQILIDYRIRLRRVWQRTEGTRSAKHGECT